MVPNKKKALFSRILRSRVKIDSTHIKKQMINLVTCCIENGLRPHKCGS